MKLAVLTTSLSRRHGGVSEAARRLAQETARLGVETSAHGIWDPDFEQDAALWAPLPTHAHRARGPASFGFSPELARGVRAAAPDVVHVHGLWTYAGCIARKTRRPYIVSVHGMLDPWAVRNSGLKKALAAFLFERRNLQDAACLHAITPAEVEAIRAYGLKTPVCLIPNGVDLPSPLAGTEPPPWTGRLAEGAKVLLYLGRIHPKKGLPALLEAWRGFSRGDDRWALVVAGWDQGGHEDELRAQVEQHGLGRSVFFAGPQFGSAKASCFRHADAFILPSLSEGLPLVVLEAWSWKLPLIMTPECNLPEGFTVGAALSTAPEAGALENSLRRLASIDSNQLKEMGQRGFDLANQHFSWERLAASIKEVYQWAHGSGPLPKTVTAS